MKSFAARREMFKCHAWEMVRFLMELHRQGQSKEFALYESDVHRFLKRHFLGVVFHDRGQAVWVDRTTEDGRVIHREAFSME